MSDGPHKSLRMRPLWRLAAERAANMAHAPDEVCEAMYCALKEDIREAPIGDVREIMTSDTLFPDMRNDQLEALRARHSRSSTANSLIDCAIEANAAGVAGDAGMTVALAAALEDIARSAMRGIDEHYQREAGARASRALRGRLDDAFGNLDCSLITRELLAPAQLPSRRSVEIPRRKGIDEGPPL